MPPPVRAVIPVDQCLGAAARPLVSVGDHVLAGQPIARAEDTAPDRPGPQVHASISGIVTAIETRLCAGREVSERLCVVIDGDGKDLSFGSYDDLGDPLAMPPNEIRESIADAGIVGLGGALYSTAAKLGPAQPIEALIVNGAECEPYITCDEILMRDHADRILRGTQIMLRALETELAIIAVESDMPEARVALYDAIETEGCDHVHVAVVTAKYPAGGERQLIELIMNREVPEDGLPADVGVVCQNVGTAAAVADLFDDHRPLISRIVTVTGRGIVSPANIDARIGTPIRDLFEICGGLHDDISHLVMGGPMMGITLPDDSLPVTKATNCIIVMQTGDVSPEQAEMPCIRCGECLQVCPSRLLPQELLTAARLHDMDALQALGLNACIECGCCDFVCPSQIQLTRRFIETKDAYRRHRDAQRRAERARQRYAAREARLADQRKTEAEALERQTAADKRSIEAIMERARDKER